MARKQLTNYVCQNCGAITSAWAGRCPQCGEWNTLQEEMALTVSTDTAVLTGRELQPEAVDTLMSHDHPRLQTHITDVDTILGGGIVAGSVNLIAGQPGIGKSTLLLQLAYAVAAHVPVLYVSAEESAHQVGMRANRLGAIRPELQLATSTKSDDIVSTIATGKYKLVIIDSIQTISCESISSAAGTVSQITNS